MSYLLNKSFFIEFEIKKVISRLDDGYSILDISVLKYGKDYDATKFKSMRLKGVFPVIFEGDIFEGTVVMKESNVFGYFLKAVDLRYKIPHTKKTLASFLKKRVPALKKDEVMELIEVGGNKVVSKIVKDITPFAERTSISERRLKNIAKKLEGDVFLEELMFFMQTMRINSEIATHIYQVYGLNSVAEVKQNPYKILSIKEIAFEEADKIAHTMKIPFDDTRRIRSAILEYLTIRENNNGDVCVKKEVLFNELSSVLAKIGVYKSDLVIPETVILNSYNILLRKQRIIEENGYVYLKKLYDAETNICDAFKVFKVCPVSLLKEEQIDFFLHGNTNAAKQNEAIKTALTSKCSILTGGPGSGKTYTVNQIVKCLLVNKPNARIRLLAPTGRASSKMAEVTGLPASTIHKALKLKPTSNNAEYFSKDEKVILDDDLVIVDESSMNDILIFSELLLSISPETALLIVGDENQLSSVGPGLVLRDIINSGVIPTICLTEVFRQAKKSQIVSNANKLKNGIGIEENGITFDESKEDFYFIERCTIEKTMNTIVSMVQRCIECKRKTIWDIMVLSPVKDGLIGVYNLNREIQNVVNPKAFYKKEFVIDGLTTIRIGDKVINTQNDSDLNVNNGDIGKVVDIEDDGLGGNPKITVDFTFHEVVYNSENLKYLELAYCITVHKSQGSEADIVIMPISPEHNFNLNKRLVYTGWTRAKQMVICVGNKCIINDVVKRDEKPRISRLMGRLKELVD